MTSLGRLARGEAIEVPTTATGAAAGDGVGGGEKMEVDSGAQLAVKEADAVVSGTPSGQQGGGGAGGGGGKKKKKGKR